jgi:hypothetical protein
MARWKEVAAQRDRELEAAKTDSPALEDQPHAAAGE